MPVCRVVCVCLLVLLLAACGGGPLREDVIAQARPGGKVAFDVVKIDDAVLNTLEARQQQPFGKRFKEYVPPPELKIAVGDTVSVVVWEAGSEGLFGNSLTELSFSAGAAAKLLTERASPIGGVPGTPVGLAPAPGLLAELYGGAAAASPAAGGLGAVNGGQPPAGAGARGAPGAPGAEAGGLPSIAALGAQRLQQFIDLAEQSGRPGTQIPDQQVGPDGAISIPYAGRLRIAGLTPGEAQQLIEKRLDPLALEPQALVVVKRSAVNAVSVTGGVVDGKRVPLSSGGDRLLQVIAAAGGAKAPVHDTYVQLSREGVTATVPLSTLVAHPDQDIFAKPGDVLTLVKRPQTLSVFGATGANRTITFTKDRMSLSEALGNAGGLLDERADPQAVFLFRYEPLAVVRALGQPIATDAHRGLSPVVYRLDLENAKSYLLARRFPVRDKDVIFVADAESQPLYRFFQVLSTLTGPAISGVLVCGGAGC